MTQTRSPARTSPRLREPRDPSAAAAPRPEAAVSALERGFDGPVPPALRAVAVSGGVAAADRRAGLAEAKLYERQAGEARLAVCRRRLKAGKGPPEADPELARLAAALARSRRLAAARLAAAVRRA